MHPFPLRRRMRPRPAGPRVRRRAGFTLLEMVVSMTLLLAVLAIATNMYSQQNVLVTSQAGRLEALQSARFALTAIERELRMAGAGTVPAQPMLVAAGPRVIAFNVNLVSDRPRSEDTKPVYNNEDADPLAVRVFQVGDAITLPTTTDAYPDSTYRETMGAPSEAETIMFWVERDPQSPVATDHILWRRVNATKPEIIARNIQVGPGDTVFHFYKFNTQGAPVGISQALQPMLHLHKEHGAATDTGRLGGLIDSVRAVRVRLRSAVTDVNGERTVRQVESMVRVMNAGLSRRTTCGEAPLGVSPSAVALTAANGVRSVRLSWSKSIDETAGERDVERYAIYRRPSSQPAFGEPLSSIPAGQSSYEWNDTEVVTGEQWVYGVASVDCSPRSSSITSTLLVIIP